MGSQWKMGKHKWKGQENCTREKQGNTCDQWGARERPSELKGDSFSLCSWLAENTESTDWLGHVSMKRTPVAIPGSLSFAVYVLNGWENQCSVHKKVISFTGEKLEKSRIQGHTLSGSTGFLISLPNLSRIFPRVWDISAKAFVPLTPPCGMTGLGRLWGRFFT